MLWAEILTSGNVPSILDRSNSWSFLCHLSRTLVHHGWRLIDSGCSTSGSQSLAASCLLDKSHTHTHTHTHKNNSHLCMTQGGYQLWMLFIYCSYCRSFHSISCKISHLYIPQIIITSLWHWYNRGIAGSALDHRSLPPKFESRIYLKGVSSLNLLHYFWGSLGPFSLPCAQKWP